MASIKPDETQRCNNPLCDAGFEQTGLAMKPRHFCSDQCKQQASLIRRVAALFDGLPDARVIKVLRGKHG
jgi:hypothetical protein